MGVPKPHTDRDPAVELKEDWASKLPQANTVPVDCSNERGFPPWIICQALPHFLGKYILETKYRKKLLEAMEIPRKGTQFEGLRSVVESFFNEVHMSATMRDWSVLRMFNGDDP